jgi:hypothetical protein
MSEPFSFRKLITSPMTPLYWVKVVMIGGGIFFLLFVGNAVYNEYLKPKQPTTTIGSAGVVNQDCSQQVQQALKKTEPFLKFRIWKIMEIRLGNT